MKQDNNQDNIGLFRHFAAMFYDWFLLIAVILVAVTLFTVPVGMLFGSDSTEALLTHPVSKLAYQLYLLSVGLFFYVWFWVHGGQTLGLKVWKLKLINTDGHTPTYRQALLRIMIACITCLPFGFGFFWKLFNLIWANPRNIKFFKF